MPVHVLQRERKLAAPSVSSRRELGRPPTDEELAAPANFRRKQVREVRDAARVLTSLDRPVGEQEETTLGELFERATRVSRRRWR